MSSQIKVMSYNIHFTIGSDDVPDWKRTADLIKAEDPDIVGLEEVTIFHKFSPTLDTVKEFRNYLKWNVLFGKTIDLYEGKGQYGLAIASKYPIKEVAKIYLPTPEHLYETKATYEKDGVAHLAVECYASGPRKTVLGLANTIEARALFAKEIIAYKKERRALHRQKVCAGRGLKETVEESLVANTDLTMDEVKSLGHGFYNRVSAVRRQMTKWNKAGHSFSEVMSWSEPGHRGQCAAPWAVFAGWKRELEILKGIILLAEYCKSNDLDFQTEFAKDTRRIKVNRGR